MRATIVSTLLGLGAVALAQDISALPVCAVSKLCIVHSPLKLTLLSKLLLSQLPEALAADQPM